VPQRWFYAQKFVRWRQKFGEGSWVEARKLAFFFSRKTLKAMRQNKQIGHCNGTGQAISAHTGQADHAHCADKIETGVCVLNG